MLVWLSDGQLSKRSSRGSSSPQDEARFSALWDSGMHVMVSNQKKGSQKKSIPILLLKNSLWCAVEIVSGCYVYGGRWVAWLRNNPELLGSAPRHNQLPSLISHISQSCPWILQHLTSTLLELRTSSKSKYSLWILPSKVVFYHFFFPFYFVRSGGSRKEWHCLVTDSARHFVTLTCSQSPPRPAQAPFTFSMQVFTTDVAIYLHLLFVKVAP